MDEDQGSVDLIDGEGAKHPSAVMKRDYPHNTLNSLPFL